VRRFIIILILALILVALIILVLVALESERSATAQGTDAKSPFDERMVTLDRLALDEAYRNQLTHLFETWLKDSHGQPDRAIKGARQARRAYIAVMQEIIKREQALKDP
jgi:hypothetical protein